MSTLTLLAASQLSNPCLVLHANTSSCLWSAWGAWETCSAECGGGDQRRFRILLVGSDGEVAEGGGDNVCEGDHADTRGCNLHICGKG